MMSNIRWRRILKLAGGKTVVVSDLSEKLYQERIITKQIFKLKVPEVSEETSDEIIKKIQKRNLRKEMKLERGAK